MLARSAAIRSVTGAPSAAALWHHHLAAFRLAGDQLQQRLAIVVVILRRIERLFERVHQRPGHGQLAVVHRRHSAG